MIELRNVCFKYDKAVGETLKDVSFKMKPGEVLAVTGPSGGGKSTLLRVIAGLERPKCGEILLDDKLIAGDSTFTSPEKRGIGMVFQDYALFPHMTVQKNIEYGLKGRSWSERNKRVQEVLRLVKLEDCNRKYPYELSGGQQQRIALARAVAPCPQILLLDEPFSNLDSHLLERVREELFSIIRKIGTTTIMVTHNPEDAKKQADRIIRISGGVAEEVRQPQDDSMKENVNTLFAC